MSCIHGHPFLPNEDVCEEGHAGNEPPEDDPTQNVLNPQQPPANSININPNVVMNNPTALNPQLPPIASLTDLQNVITQMLTIQQNTTLLQQQQQQGQQTINTTVNRPDTRSKAKPERPTIKQNSTEGEWGLFLDCWTRYKQMCKLTDPSEIRNELRCTCAAEVNRLLYDLIGPTILNACTETQ